MIHGWGGYQGPLYQRWSVSGTGHRMLPYIPLVRCSTTHYYCITPVNRLSYYCRSPTDHFVTVSETMWIDEPKRYYL